MATTIADFDRRFRIPEVAQIVAGSGGWPKVQVMAPSASGEVYLHGAHVTSWKPAGAEEVLFLSPNSIWQEGKAIRGGVPLCYPWFGDKVGDAKAPAHGLVRTKIWQLESVERVGDSVVVTLSAASDDSMRQWFPAAFRATYRVTFGPELVLELTTENPGSSPLKIEEALHTYYRVGDVSRARVAGLDGTEYMDKTDGFRHKKQSGQVVITKETDSVYLNTQAALEISDPVLRRRIKLTKENSNTTVVWNPWQEKSRDMKDLGEGQWLPMLCIEASNVGDFAVQVAPGERHTIKATTCVAPT